MSNLLLDASEESVELSEDLTEDDSEGENTEKLYEFNWKWHSIETIAYTREIEMKATYRDPHLMSDFRPEAQLPPPKC